MVQLIIDCRTVQLPINEYRKSSPFEAVWVLEKF